ncbi:TetR/AcrR family transcriptional regulator [Skermania sp. ID1734]|uniref:TetR/AcrR family transcriptional regulator n=1 Tax=Skermania sp. ID1734 TaxID=2597516 RepID=UPI0011808361|nr:TetR family transcriptional regulator [Skermania sp. ID1734]TSD94627.1 TetR/AcrR family transcriptional regulator [Skermania sp. ID1734]
MTASLDRIPYAKAARNLLRESVLSATDELVRRNGWAATSISTLARAAGVSRQTVYNEFGSRQSIAEAYVLHRMEVLLEQVCAKLTAHDTLEDGMRNALELFFEACDEPLIQTALDGDRTNLIDLVRMANEIATDRLAAAIRDINPTISADDAIIFADTVARIAMGHAMAPTLPRDVAIDRMVRLAVIVLQRD